MIKIMTKVSGFNSFKVSKLKRSLNTLLKKARELLAIENSQIYFKLQSERLRLLKKGIKLK
jgi:hypothetical protein